MFALVKDPAHWWPVSFNVPADGGAIETKTIELKFVRLDIVEYRELWGAAMATAASDQDEAKPDATTENRRLFDRCVRGWRNIVDGEGSPLSFADPWIGQMLTVGNFPEAFGLAYIQFWHAIPATIMGNSEPSPVGGPATADAAPAAATKTTGPRSRRRSESGAQAKRT